MRRFMLAVLLACVSCGAAASTLVAAVAEKDYPPFYYFDDDTQQWRGISVEVCERVAQELGYTLEYRRYPFGRLLQHVSDGRADIACTLFNTSQRAPGVTFTSIPHAFETVSVFRRVDNTPWESQDINWLRQFQLGGIRAYYYGEALQDDSEFKKLRVNDEEQLIKVLLGGRVEYALGNKPAIELHADRLGVRNQIEFLEPPVFRGPIYIAISRQREDAYKLASDFTRVVQRFRDTDEYLYLLQEYGMDPMQF